MDVKFDDLVEVIEGHWVAPKQYEFKSYTVSEDGAFVELIDAEGARKIVWFTFPEFRDTIGERP